MVLVKVAGEEFELKERDLILAESKRSGAQACLALIDSFSKVDQGVRIYLRNPVFRLNHYAHTPQVTAITKSSIIDANLRLLRVGHVNVSDCLYARSYGPIAARVERIQPPYDLAALMKNFR